MPTQLALVFFAMLHIPLNLPALSLSIKEDNLDADRELVNHGLSNLLAGLVGSIPNYRSFKLSVATTLTVSSRIYQQRDVLSRWRRFSAGRIYARLGHFSGSPGRTLGHQLSARYGSRSTDLYVNQWRLLRTDTGQIFLALTCSKKL
jgi:hypothetical protein